MFGYSKINIITLNEEIIILNPAVSNIYSCFFNRESIIFNCAIDALTSLSPFHVKNKHRTHQINQSYRSVSLPALSFRQTLPQKLFSRAVCKSSRWLTEVPAQGLMKRTGAFPPLEGATQSPKTPR